MDAVGHRKTVADLVREMQRVIANYGDMPVVLSEGGHGFEPELWTAGNAGEGLTLVIMGGQTAGLPGSK